MLTPALFILVILALLALFFWSLRGRRVDDHPVCRRCKFDLVGNPHAATCPECGRDLSQPRAIETGNRKRHTFIATFALVLILLGLLCGSTLTFSAGAQKYLPVPVLRWEASFPSTSNSDAALAELLHRLKAGKLSKTQIASVAGDALKVQADLASPWKITWGDFIEQAKTTGNLPAKDWQAYTACAMKGVYRLVVRPKVRRGGPLPFAVRQQKGQVRLGSQSQVEYAFTRIKVDGKPRDMRGGYPLWPRNERVSVNQQQSIPSYPLQPFGGETNSLKPGTHHMRIRMLVAIRSNGRNLAATHQTVAQSFQTLPADTPSVQPVTDAKYAAAMQKAIQADGDFKVGKPTMVGPRAYCTVSFNTLPIPLSCQAIARDEHGTMHEIDRFTIAANTQARKDVDAYINDTKSFHAHYVDIILKPDPSFAAMTVDMTRYWAKPIILKHIKVDWSGVPKEDRPTS